MSRRWPRGPGAIADQLDPAALQPRDLTGVVEVANDPVALAQDRSHVELAGDGLGRAGNPAGLGERLGRTQQRLREHASIERALATDEVRLDDHHLVALDGRPARQHLASRSGPDHDHVKTSEGSSDLLPAHGRASSDRTLGKSDSHSR